MSRSRWLVVTGMVRTAPAWLLGLLVSLLLVSCDGGEGWERIDLTERETGKIAEAQVEPIRVAVGAVITPRAGVGYYWELLKYLEARVGRPIQVVDRRSYREVNRLLGAGGADMAFVCSLPYVLGKERYGLELLVAPVVDGETTYRSYVIVPAGSPYLDLDDLRGARFAFTDPMSNTGCLVPTHALVDLGETPEAFFGEVHYTHGHDRSIQAVAQGAVDGAAVDSLVWRNLDRTWPELTSRTRIIRRLGPYGIPPVVTRAGLDPGVREALRKALLEVDRDAEGMRILDGMGIDRFTAIGDEAYDGIRAMRRRLAGLGVEVGQGER